MLSGDNGILQKATDAKTGTTVGQEKETIALAYNSALAKKVGNGDSTEVTAENMNTELTNQGASADGSNPIIVTFTASKRQYTVNNGIIDYAGIKTDNSEGEGLESLSSAELALLPTGVTEKNIENISNDNLKNATKIKAVITDSDNGEVPIPKGANYKEGTESTGVVIEYKGSEFVWVPINSNLTAKGTTKPMAKSSTAEGFAGTDSNGRTNYEGVLYDFGYLDNSWNWQSYSTSQVMSSYGQGTTLYREPDIVSNYDNDTSKPSGSDSTYLGAIGLTQATFKTEMQENYNAMIESVTKYGGFYVGRYETSIDSTTTVASKAGTPMSGATDSQMWYGMYDKQKKFTTNSDVMQSSMIWGSQYDAMLNWMQNGTQGAKVIAITNGNHSSNQTTTGGTTNDVINNIYDLEGNLAEWTLEANLTYGRAHRGGSITNSNQAYYREYCSPDYTDLLGSRLALYIK